jgi:hypothetical protein
LLRRRWLLAWVGYHGLGAEYPHQVIRHTQGEYVKGRIHTQTIEGFWSLFKRQVYGIHHWFWKSTCRGM